MINITQIEDAVKFAIDGNEETSYPLNEIYFTVNKGTDLITFKNINSDRIIVNELINNITVEGNPTNKDSIIQDLNPILYKIGGGGSEVDLSNYYTKDETDALLDNYYTKEENDALLDDYYTKEEVNDLIANIGSGNLLAKCPINKLNLDTTEFQAIDESGNEGTTFEVYRNGNVVNIILSLKTTGNVRNGDNAILIGGVPEGYRPITTLRFNNEYADTTFNNEILYITIYPDSRNMNLRVSNTVAYDTIINIGITYITNDAFPTADII